MLESHHSQMAGKTPPQKIICTVELYNYKLAFSLFHFILITVRTRLWPIKGVSIGTGILLHQSIKGHLSCKTNTKTFLKKMKQR